MAGYQAVGVVVGLPLSLSGQMGPAARGGGGRDRRSSRTRLTVDVVAVDERLTTRVAAGTLRAEGRRARDQRGVIDQNAAALVLQTWVEQRRSGALEAEGTGVRDR